MSTPQDYYYRNITAFIPPINAELHRDSSAHMHTLLQYYNCRMHRSVQDTRCAGSVFVRVCVCVGIHLERLFLCTCRLWCVLDMTIAYDSAREKERGEREREDGEERGRRTGKKDAVEGKIYIYLYIYLFINIKYISSVLPWKGT